jgi:hypothetical protein
MSSGIEGYYVEGGETRVESATTHFESKPRYTLDELLAKCDPEAPLADEDRLWLNLPPVGQEL